MFDNDEEPPLPWLSLKLMLLPLSCIAVIIMVGAFLLLLPLLIPYL